MAETNGKGKRSRKLTGVYPALWCWLLKPDTRWKAEGEYGCDMVMTKDEAQALVKVVMEDVGIQLADVRKQEKGQFANWPLKWPVRPYDGDEAEYTGKMLVQFRQPVRKDFNFHVDVFDAKKNEVSKDLRIGNGTRLKVCFTVRVVASTIDKTIRVKFHPVAAQIIELVKWEANYGFEDEEGFTSAGPTTDSGEIGVEIHDDVPDFGAFDEPTTPAQPKHEGSQDRLMAFRHAWGIFSKTRDGDSDLKSEQWNKLLARTFPGRTKEQITVKEWNDLIDKDFGDGLPEFDPPGTFKETEIPI